MRLRELVLVAVGYLCVAVLWTWPLAANLSGSVPYDPRFTLPARAESWVGLRDLFGIADALARGVSPYLGDRIDWPFGRDLRDHPLALGWGILSLPLQAIAGAGVALGVGILVRTGAAATAMWALARAAGASRTGAGLAGWLWAFSPFFAQRALEGLPLAASPWPPLLLLFAARWSTAGEAAERARAAAGTGLVLGLSLLGAWAATLWLAALALVFVLVRPAVLPGAPPARRRLLVPRAVLIALLCCGAFAAVRPLPHPAPAFGSEGIGRPDLRDFWTPPGLHPLLRERGAARYGGAFSARSALDSGTPPVIDPDQAGLYLGIALLTLAVAGLAFVPRARRLGAMALAGFVLAWDPGGLLSSIWTRAPALAAVGDTARLLPVATLPLALAAALGWDALRAQRLGRLACIWLALLGLFELWTGPVPAAPIEIPSAVRAIGAGPGKGAVLVLPLIEGPHDSMAWPAVHGRPVSYSPTAGSAPPAPLLWRQRASDLFALISSDSHAIDPDGLEFDLDLLDVDHVLVIEEEIEVFEQLAELLDGIDRRERGRVADGVAWWYRSSLVLTAAR